MIYLSQDEPKKTEQKLFSALLTNYARNYVIDIGKGGPQSAHNKITENWNKQVAQTACPYKVLKQNRYVTTLN